MRIQSFKSVLIKSALAASGLLLATGASFAQQQVNLSAGPATATLPDGSAVPMWGYSCGTAAAGSSATCAALNASAGTGWSPVMITVPTGQDLQINLTNKLIFGTNAVPTSLTIVGQLGGGLGATPTRSASPTHGETQTTWSTIVNSTFAPPPQGGRVQSFATEVQANGTPVSLCWGVCGGNTPPLKPGTYLIESGTHPSIQGPMGLYGVLVVTAAPGSTGTAPSTVESSVGTAYPGVNYDAEVPILMSEIDPVQNAAVSAAVNAAFFSETAVWSGQPRKCGNPATTISSTVPACYPPAVNYTPLYYMMNGVAFNRTNAAASLFAVAPATLTPASGTGTLTGNVLVRFVNAGLRMHVPSIVGSQTAGAQTEAPLASGFSLIAEDGNPLPGIPRVQSEVFMAAGKTYDVMINGPALGAPALAVFDRELSLSGNAIDRDAGMLAYLAINPGSSGAGGTNGGSLPPAASLGAATANADTYDALVAGQAFTLSDPSKGVLANDVNVYGVKVVVSGVAQTGPVALANGTVTLQENGTFTYVPSGTATTDSFTYCGNGAVTGPACASVTLGAAAMEGATGITYTAPVSFQSNVATYLSINPPGALTGAVDAAGHPLSVDLSTVSVVSGPGALNLVMNPNGNGSFKAAPTAPGTYTFTFQARNSQGTDSSTTQTVTLNFPVGSGLTVAVLDGSTNASLPLGPNGVPDYRWVIEEDQTFYVDPKCAQNPPPAGCPGANQQLVPTFGVNFHTSHMPFVAQGCTGPLSCEKGQTVLGQPMVCDLGNGGCEADTAGIGHTPVLPGAVALDPTKRYYLSILPGDAADTFTTGYAQSPNCGGSSTATTTAGSSTWQNCGHGMGGAPVPALCLDLAAGTTCAYAAGTPYYSTFSLPPVSVLTQPNPYQPGAMSIMVFEDDFPLNGEQDSGGGVDVLAPNEPGLGGFNIILWDAMAQNGDFSGQMTYDMFNQPLTNSLDGTIDPVTGLDACPITLLGLNSPATSGGITGMMVTCPKYEGNGTSQVLSPLGGQVVIKNLMPGRFEVIATPGADRIARGEEWHQTNTLDGQHAIDTFIRIGEPTYFQEFGPASYHAVIGFANPAIINGRRPGVCAGTDPNLTIPAGQCTNTVVGKVTTERMSRVPDERLYSSGSHDSFYWTNCYISFGDPDGEDFAFTKCNADGTFTLSGLPPGTWRVTVFDQWDDMLVDGLSTPVAITGPNQTVNMGDIATNQWQINMYTRTFLDANKDGVSQSSEDGIPFLNTTVRYRDGSLANNLQTDFTGTANFNETFPLFNWYVVETDVTRYKNTGTHVVYDSGGPADGTPACGVSGYPPCGTSTIGKFLANTAEVVSLPSDLRVPGSVYCAGADCIGKSVMNGPTSSDPPSVCTPSVSGPAGFSYSCSTTLSTGRIDNPWFGGTEGWQGFSGQNNFLEFGKAPYIPGENGGIHGHVIYASTRPFDDPQMLVQTQWEPLVPNVTINLYQEGVAPDGSQTLTLVDTTQTSSWDAFAQGFRTQADGVTPVTSTAGAGSVPNINCPGQSTLDLFFFTLQSQPNWMDLYTNVEHGSSSATTPLAYASQFKCYDGMHNWNQVQPAPYDGMYSFPSVTAVDPNTGKPTKTNCTICGTNPATDLYAGLPMLPPGKYVVEVVVPPGMELVKEEDKNILIGDQFIAPAIQEFGSLTNIFITPDQASIAANYNANNAQNQTQMLGTSPNDDTVPGFTVEPTWPCVGQQRIVPDYISLFPQTKQVSPFAGATRNLCDRKEVTLGDQMGAIAKFYIFSSTHIASKMTGVITDDFTSEFDPFSPMFGEKFSPPNMPVSIKDWTGTEISRVYSDQWGTYNALTYSTWEVNPPNPTGYAPTMMITCMNDPGPTLDPLGSGKIVRDPLFNPAYSQFCYEQPYMPGTTQYLDTPVVPTAAFAGAGYNNVDCAYPIATPAVSSVVNTNAETGADGKSLAAGSGPWVSAAGDSLTITALGDTAVNNYGYSGPAASTAPFNQKTVTRHYGFGAQCTSPTAGSTTCNSISSVTIGGKPATISNWNDTSITVIVPAGIANCAVQQQAQYGGSTAQCGEMTITAGSGQQSIDAVTVTIGGKTPTLVTSANPMTPTGAGSIQQAIDAALPGDLIIVPAGNYNEMIIMWKPVRLQGVGAVASVINANTQPAGKLDPWRRSVNCLFGLATNGTPIGTTNPYDSAGQGLSCPTGAAGGASGMGPDGVVWNGFSGVAQNPQVDRLPLEGIVGWDTTTNGNLAQMLQEPTLMGAYEGAGITVLSKGVNPAGSASVDGVVVGYYGSGAEAAFPTGTTWLDGSNASCGKGTKGSKGYVANPFPSSFQCNPSRIDGLSVTDSSQGGGGIFVHAWAHNLEIANNRVFNNIGTLSGGINIGQGESPDGYLAGTTNDSDPSSCIADPSTRDAALTNLQLPYCYDINVNVHNNAVTLNTSIGDELFSGTPTGAGGVSFCTGADYYKFNYNWVCGNMSTGDGGGFAHIGYIWNGDIEHNALIFNQSTNPTIQTNGGGIIVMGAAPDGFNASGVECGSTTDVDCAPGLPDGTGPGLVINANLIMGNAASSGSGGGVRLQSVNGTEVSYFPNGSQCITFNQSTLEPTGLGRCTGASNQRPVWNTVTLTNNLIVNNVAGWDGGGISLQDALYTNIVNNTIAANDTTATAGPLFNTLGAPLASAPNPVVQTTSASVSAPQPAGLVTMLNSSNLTATFAGLTITCPANHYAPGSASAKNSTCTQVSYPLVANDLFWQNRSFQIGVGSLSNAYQQNIVTLFNSVFTGQNPTVSPASQSSTGQCVSGSSYWDIGVRGDTGPGQYAFPGLELAPTYSALTNASENGYGSNNLTAANPAFVSQYCNGSRVPPEAAANLTGAWKLAALGWQVPPGISDATVPNPIFSLQPNATVDEGNNWVNISWGPLASTNPSTGVTLGNYALNENSPAINFIPVSATTQATMPTTDFFGNPRPDPANPNAFDIGAVEYAPSGAASLGLSATSISFGNQLNGSTTVMSVTLSNGGAVPATGITYSSLTGTGFVRATSGTCGASLAGGADCTLTIEFQPAKAQSMPLLAYGPATLAIGSANAGALSLNLSGSSFLLFNPTTLTFSESLNGTSTAQSVTLTNAGTSPLFLTGFAVTTTSGGANQFVIPGGGNTCGATLTGGNSCTVALEFHPNSGSSPKYGEFNVNVATGTAGNGASNPYSVVLTGNVLEANPVFSGPTPSLVTGTTAIHSGLITVTNSGTGPLTLTAAPTVARAGGGTNYFSVLTAPVPAPAGTQCASGVTLQVNGTCWIDVQYNPHGTTTTESGQVTIRDTGAVQATQASPTFNAN
jgi:hypothetical protein